MGNEGIPFVMVFTKVDKLSQTQISKNLKNYKIEMLKNWESTPEIFITSSEKKKRNRGYLKLY